MSEQKLIVASKLSVCSYIGNDDELRLKDGQLGVLIDKQWKDLDAPTFFIIGGLEEYLKKALTFIVGTAVQCGSGPLQPEDEALFRQASKECLGFAANMTVTINETIQAIKLRKEKQNLSIQPE